LSFWFRRVIVSAWIVGIRVLFSRLELRVTVLTNEIITKIPTYLVFHLPGERAGSGSFPSFSRVQRG
jgi:hypothetical protein